MVSIKIKAAERRWLVYTVIKDDKKTTNELLIEARFDLRDRLLDSIPGLGENDGVCTPRNRLIGMMSITESMRIDAIKDMIYGRRVLPGDLRGLLLYIRDMASFQPGTVIFALGSRWEFNDDVYVPVFNAYGDRRELLISSAAIGELHPRCKLLIEQAP